MQEEAWQKVKTPKNIILSQCLIYYYQEEAF